MRMGEKKQPERMVRNRAEETSESRKRANHDAIQLAGPDNNSNNNSNSNNSKSSSSTLRPSSSSSATSASPSSSSNYRAPRRGRCNYAAHTVTSVGFAGFGSPPISCAKMIFVKKKQKRKRNKNAKTEKKNPAGRRAPNVSVAEEDDVKIDAIRLRSRCRVAESTGSISNLRSAAFLGQRKKKETTKINAGRAQSEERRWSEIK